MEKIGVKKIGSGFLWKQGFQRYKIFPAFGFRSLIEFYPFFFTHFIFLNYPSIYIIIFISFSNLHNVTVVVITFFNCFFYLKNKKQTTLYKNTEVLIQLVSTNKLVERHTICTTQ